MADGTYDDHQLAAREFACVTCGRRYYQTVNWGPREQCLICEPNWRPARASTIDVNGHELTGP